MAKEKPTQVGIDRMIGRLSILKSRREHLDKIRRLKDSPDWDAMKSMLEDMIGMHSKQVTALVENGDGLEDHIRIQQMESSKARRDALKWVVQIVEKPDSEVEALNANITDLEYELAGKREELADIS